MDNPRLNPILADISTLPDRILLIIPTLDILLSEQRKFVERVQKDIDSMQTEASSGRGKVIEAVEFEGCVHGWVDCESALPSPADVAPAC
jgi:hypothetical protein